MYLKGGLQESSLYMTVDNPAGNTDPFVMCYRLLLTDSKGKPTAIYETVKKEGNWYSQERDGDQRENLGVDFITNFGNYACEKATKTAINEVPACERSMDWCTAVVLRLLDDEQIDKNIKPPLQDVVKHAEYYLVHDE